MRDGIQPDRGSSRRSRPRRRRARTGAIPPETDEAIRTGDGARATNAGRIELVGQISEAVSLGDGGRLENLAGGSIIAEEVSGAGGDVAAIDIFPGSALMNAGTIRVIGDTNGPRRGTAVRLQSGGGILENTGTLDGDDGLSGYDYPVEGFDLIPEFGITYSKIWQDGFTEKGADSLNLRVNDADAHSLVTSLGVRVGTEFQSGNTSIRPQALLRYEYDWNASDDDAHDIVSSFATVPSAGSIDIIGQNRGEHGLLLAGGVTAQVSETANLFAGAGYRWNSNGDEYSFGVGARVAW